MCQVWDEVRCRLCKQTVLWRENKS